MRTLEVRRHAQRDPEADRLSEEGRAQAQSVGASLAGGYAVVFISPAQRAAETVAWFLRGLGEQLPRTPSCRASRRRTTTARRSRWPACSRLCSTPSPRTAAASRSRTPPDRARGARALGPGDRAARRVRGRPAVQGRGRVTGRDRGAPPPELIRGPLDPARGLRPRRRARRVARTGPAPAVLRGLAWRRPSRAARDGRRERYLRRLHAAARRRVVVARAERDVPAGRAGDRRRVPRVPRGGRAPGEPPSRGRRRLAAAPASERPRHRRGPAEPRRLRVPRDDGDRGRRERRRGGRPRARGGHGPRAPSRRVADGLGDGPARRRGAPRERTLPADPGRRARGRARRARRVAHRGGITG